VYFESGKKATPEEIADVYKAAKAKAERRFKASGHEEKLKQHEDSLEQLAQDLESGDITEQEYEERIEKLLQ